MATLALLFFLSGSGGLVQEVAWARVLGQSLGSSLQAITAVLVAFLGGLGLGSIVAGRPALRSASPLRVYAWLEAGVALYAALTPALAGLLPRCLEVLGPHLASPGRLGIGRLGLALVLLAPVTLMMGATLPFMVRAGILRGGAPERAVPLLYGSNTLGAALGAAAGSFAFLPFLGTRSSFLAAAALHLITAAAALAISGRRTAASPGAAPFPGHAAPASPAAPVTTRPLFPLTVACLSGTVGALLQVGWTRTMTLTFGSSIYALGLTLTAYILGLGVGPLLLPRRLLRRGVAAWTAAAAQWILGLSSLLVLARLGGLPEDAARLSGSLADRPLLLITATFSLAVGLLLVPTLAQGATFPALAMLAGDDARVAPRSTALVYALSTWGSVAGFMLAGFVALPRWGTERTLIAAGTTACLLSVLLFLLGRSAGGPLLRDGRATLTVSLVVLILASPLVAGLLPRWSPTLMAAGGFLYGPLYRSAVGPDGMRQVMQRRGPIVFMEESGDSLVTVRRSRAGILSLQINGKTEASTGGDMATQLLAGHLPLRLHPEARDVMVIGLASGITLGAVQTYPVRAVTAIEIVPAVAEAARLFAAENHNALDDTRTRLVLDDARAHLLTRPARYDVITSQPSNPWVAGVPNLFTLDFYRLAARRLRPGGLFCQWVQAYRLSRDDLRGIVATFLTAFPQATLWEESAGGGDYFLVGKATPWDVDPATLRSHPDAWRDLARGGVPDPAALLSRFVSGPEGLRAFARGARLHTDDDLYLEWRAPLALFRDTLKEQLVELNRFREPVLAWLAPGSAQQDPALLEALSRGRRARDLRLSVLESLGAADLAALSDPFVAAGLGYLRAGLFAEATAALSHAAAGSGGAAPTVHLLLGESYRALGLDAPALVAFHRAVEIEPRLAAGWNALGRQLAAAGRPDEALEALTRATAIDPELATAHNNRGALLLRRGDLTGAGEALRLALSCDPSLSAAHANLGLLLKRRGLAQEAARQYREALEHDPLNTDARFNLARLLRQAGDERGARTELERLLRIDPEDADARRALQEGAGD